MEQLRLKTKQQEIQLYIWDEVKSPIGVVQLVHGSAEHAQRYDHFARFLNKNGWIVVANDLKGHGLTVTNQNQWGFFSEKGGWNVLVDDLKLVNDYIVGRYKELPVVMFGHSMGSFLARHYSTLYSYTIQSLIICGTAWPNTVELFFINLFMKFMKNKKNYNKPNMYIYNLSYKQFSRKIKEKNNEYAWLTRDKKVQEEFKNDPLSGHVFTTSAFADMFYGLKYITTKKNIIKTRLDLPIYLIAGINDPVGNLGQQVKKTEKKYKKYGFTRVTMKLYSGMRHEILNEIGKEQVYIDVLNFINKYEQKAIATKMEV